MVRVISISDEVYIELSKMKNGKSFTELLKKLISECVNKGDPKTISAFIKAQGPLSEASAKNITNTMEDRRKAALQRTLEQ